MRMISAEVPLASTQLSRVALESREYAGAYGGARSFSAESSGTC